MVVHKKNKMIHKYLHSIQATLKLMESPEIDWNDTSLGERR